MFGAILTAPNSSFQKGMTFCRSTYVKKVMKLLAFIFEQPSYLPYDEEYGYYFLVTIFICPTTKIWEHFFGEHFLLPHQEDWGNLFIGDHFYLPHHEDWDSYRIGDLFHLPHQKNWGSYFIGNRFYLPHHECLGNTFS